MTQDFCREMVWDGVTQRSYHCQRKATRDGWCWQHHPDAKAARLQESNRRWEEKREQSPRNRLATYRLRIEELEAEVARLKAELDTRPTGQGG